MAVVGGVDGCGCVVGHVWMSQCYVRVCGRESGCDWGNLCVDGMVCATVMWDCKDVSREGCRGGVSAMGMVPPPVTPTLPPLLASLSSPLFSTGPPHHASLPS